MANAAAVLAAIKAARRRRYQPVYTSRPSQTLLTAHHYYTPMNFRSAVKSVPGDLIFTGYTWETTREHYFMRHANWSKASEVRELRKLYAARLWDECGISVDLEEGFQ